MKKVLTIILAATLSCLCFGQTITNKYAMKLTANPDGTYSLQKEANYAKLVDLSKIEDLLVPYTYRSERLKSKMYNQVETEEVVYKHHNGYDLVLFIDKAISQDPAPVVFHCHGGGWARGNADSGRTLTKYLAQNCGITGVRVEYSLAPQDGVNVEVSIQDVMDAVQFIRENAKKYNINPELIGFIGTSAGAHLAACAAMKCPQAKLFVGYSGIYDLTTAKIVNKTKDAQRIAYFEDRDSKVLADCSPLYMMNKKKHIAAQLICGTADITVEYEQSEAFAAVLKKVKGNVVDLQVYPNYDHNLSAKASDKMEEIFFKTVDFVSANLK